MSYFRGRRVRSVPALGAMAWVVIAMSGCSGNDTVPAVLPAGGGQSYGGGATGADVSNAQAVGGSSSVSSGGEGGIGTGGAGIGGSESGGTPTGGAGSGGGVASGGTGPRAGTTGQGGGGQGGAATGGAATDGRATGGAATGGRATGGAATGGKATGGAATGGKAAGGAATGGRATGGGGKATGGAGQGGASGSASGGTSSSTGTISAAAAQYVDAINAVRAAVTEPANYSGTWTPLPKVTWSDTVAASAQAWATNLATTQNCGLSHEDQNTYGENLAMGTNVTPQAAVNMWAGEKDKYTYSAKYSMADFDAGSGHYTQLVWRTSIQVGCGSATCSGNVVVISCRFLPPGNYIGQPVY